jgi:hypothetical protein
MTQWICLLRWKTIIDTLKAGHAGRMAPFSLSTGGLLPVIQPMSDRQCADPGLHRVRDLRQARGKWCKLFQEGMVRPKCLITDRAITRSHSQRMPFAGRQWRSSERWN